MDITFGVPVPEEPAQSGTSTDIDGQSRGAVAASTTPEPIVRTQRLIIRGYRTSDAPALQRLANDAQVSRSLSDMFPYPYSLADAEKFLSIASPDEGEFALFRREADGSEGAFVGGIKLKRLSDVYSRGAEVGYWIGRESWGLGLATDAISALSRWAFESFPDLLRLEGLVYDTNPASSRVLEKAGFIHEGTRRKAAFKRGEVLDVHIYGLLRDDERAGAS